MAWGMIQHGGRAKTVRWMQAGRRNWAAWSLGLEAVVSGASRSGNSQEVVGLGVGAGRAFARIEDADMYGGLDFLAGDALLAELDSDKGEFWLKEDAKTRAPGMLPWALRGERKNIRHAKPNEYVVVRAAKQGASMSLEHVAMRGGALVAHHLEPRPPVNSSMVSDPGEGGDDEREAGLHGMMRVRRFARSFCGKYADKDDSPFYALLLNFAKSTGDNSGYGAAHFGRNEALLSYRGGGPLRDSDAEHEVAFGEAPIQQGALDVYRHLWGSEGTLFSPAEFQNQPWVDGSEGPFIKRVPWREDFAAKHTNHCGKRVQGMKKWMTYADKESLPTHPVIPPPPRDPPTDEPPTDAPPRDPGEPGRPVIDPGPIPGKPAPTLPMAYLPYQPAPTNTGPGEEEQPSLRGMSTPDIPAGPKATGGELANPEGESQVLTWQERARKERDSFWLRTYGYTEKQFYAEPRLTEIAFVPQYEYATPKSGPTKWLPKLRNPAVLTEDPETGKIIARQAAHGPGGAVVMPGMLEPWHALRAEWGKLVPTDTPESSFVLLNQNVLDDASVERIVATRLGLGSRHLTSPHTASGAEFKLTYNGPGGRTLPDLNITPKDSSGAEDVSNHARLRIWHDLSLENELTFGDAVDIAAGDNVSCGNAPLVRIILGGTLTGFEAPGTSRRRAFWLVNHSGGSVTISHDNAGSAADNRIYCPGSANLTLANRAGVFVYYDTALSRWCVVDDASSGYQPLDADLTNIAALTGTGFAVRTSIFSAWALRSLAAGSSRITITNEDGVSGNPTIDANQSAFNLDSIGGTLSVSKGGTGATSASGARTNLDVPPNSRAINNGYGITGGGDLSADRTLAVSLSNSSAFLSTAQSISSASYADLTGCSVSLAAGTWLIVAMMSASAANLAFLAHLAITDASNNIVRETSQGVPASGTASVHQWANLAVHAIVSPASTTTYKLRAARGNTTLTNTYTAQDGSGQGVTNNASTNTDKATGIIAIRIA